ncbi:trehalose-phosphatase [Heliorestis convoluta]|uniref:Trehalose 6-phosphate phosphatase n=1 Tax=Heliorestis convoluta TaxID=356322 RepID=A0A5Q2N0K0_9FIRM|nr:trehalose-phosphatase [Heliorestis convoluta]QGG48528.1 trehalose-phosphatase [Heliorestis convoluta]
MSQRLANQPLQSAQQLWAQLVIQAEEPLLLLLDYDGTLVPIQDKPDLARPSAPLYESLITLSKQQNLIIAIVSGRDIRELKSFLAIEGIYYVGGHGAEMEDLHGNRYNFVNQRIEWIESLAEIACQCIGSHEGFLLERKKTSFAFHYRLACPSIASVVLEQYRKKIQRILEIEKLEMVEGKKVIEVRPAYINKGTAVLQLMDRYSQHRPLYMGDDKTDEDAFKAIAGYGFTSSTVLISENPKPSYAFYRMRNSQEVVQFLQILSMRCSDGSIQSAVPP